MNLISFRLTGMLILVMISFNANSGSRVDFTWKDRVAQNGNATPVPTKPLPVPFKPVPNVVNECTTPLNFPWGFDPTNTISCEVVLTEKGTWIITGILSYDLGDPNNNILSIVSVLMNTIYLPLNQVSVTSPAGAKHVELTFSQSIDELESGLIHRLTSVKLWNSYAFFWSVMVPTLKITAQKISN